jgi:GMP synthase-like glutamine amidotransferase
MRTATCLIVQHVEAEGPGVLADALAAAGVQVRTVRIFAGDRLPVDAGGLAGIVVMGGPMSAREDAGFPSLASELVLLQDALRHQTPVLGVCLGAQLLARAAGGIVSRGAPGLEVGWGWIAATSEAAADPLLAPIGAGMRVLHWHGDTFDLPPGAVRLAQSALYPQQAFRVGPNAWGLQFHVEVDVATVLAFATVFAEEARSAGVDPRAISAAADSALAEMAPARDEILSRFAHQVFRNSVETVVQLH